MSCLFLGSSLLQILVCPRTSLRQADFPDEIRGWPVLLFTICCCKLGFSFFFVMYCVNEGRNLRNDSFSACWGKVCLYKGTEARSCGYFGNVSVCKKHHSVKTRANKQSCSFPLSLVLNAPAQLSLAPSVSCQYLIGSQLLLNQEHIFV